MGKRWLSITEQVRDGVVIRRTVVPTSYTDEEIAASTDSYLVNAPHYLPWRNGWQRHDSPRETMRTSFERCQIDQIDKTIAAVTV